MTNNEWRRICSKENFAKFICNLLKGNDLYLGIMSLKSLIQNAEEHNKDGVAEVQEWLQEEHDMSNEEWFCTLDTATKAEVMAQLSSYGGRADALEEWLKRRHPTV